MPPIAIIIAGIEEIVKYAPDALAAGQRLIAIIKNSGHPSLTPDDIALMEAFGAKTSADYLADAGGAPAAAPTAPV